MWSQTKWFLVVPPVILEFRGSEIVREKTVGEEGIGTAEVGSEAGHGDGIDSHVGLALVKCVSTVCIMNRVTDQYSRPLARSGRIRQHPLWAQLEEYRPLRGCTSGDLRESQHSGMVGCTKLEG